MLEFVVIFFFLIIVNKKNLFICLVKYLLDFMKTKNLISEWFIMYTVSSWK